MTFKIQLNAVMRIITEIVAIYLLSAGDIQRNTEAEFYHRLWAAGTGPRKARRPLCWQAALQLKEQQHAGSSSHMRMLSPSHSGSTVSWRRA